MRRATKWMLLAVLTLPVHVVVILSLTGVPKPPAITAEHVDRVAWGTLLDRVGELWAARESQSIAAWMPDGSGVLLHGRRMVLDSRLHKLSAARGTPVFLPQIPRNATLHGAPGRDYMVLAWDVGGDEEFQLYRWDLDDSDPVRLTSGSERAAFGAYEPGGHRMAYVSTRRNGRDFDVYLMDVLDPSSDQRILEMEGMWGVAGWSAAGDELLLVRMVSNVANEIYVLDLRTRDVRRVDLVGDGPVLHGAPRWSRGGDALYYSSNLGTEFQHLRRLDLGTGEETILSPDIPWDVETIEQSSDGEMLLLGVNEDGRTRYYMSDPYGRSLERLDLFSSGEFSAAFHPEQPLVTVNHSDSRGVTRAYVYDLRIKELVLWAGGDAIQAEVPEPRLVRYPTFDDVDGSPRQIPAFVYPGVGEGPRPVIINIHGGPEAQARLSANFTSSQRDGVTVITPNVRGSTGYGRTYAALDDQYLREDAVRDIGALLDWIEEQPELDGRRVAVAGGSYGGYMVLASLVHYSPRLRCGIDVVGVSNFVTFLENTAEYRRDNRRAEYGDERIPEMREFLESISPLNNAHRITAPLMVVQGANDPRVPVTESRQLVERVRANGFDVPYLEGANEGHGFRHPWNALWAGLAQQELARACLLSD